MPHKDAPHW